MLKEQTMISKQKLYQLRNHIPIIEVITHILEIPWKYRENRLRFLCPCCQGFDTAITPQTNLAHCFTCAAHYNPIDLTMLVKLYSFKQAVCFLTPLLDERTDRAPPNPGGLSGNLRNPELNERPQSRDPGLSEQLNPRITEQQNAWRNIKKRTASLVETPQKPTI